MVGIEDIYNGNAAQPIMGINNDLSKAKNPKWKSINRNGSAYFSHNANCSTNPLPLVGILSGNQLIPIHLPFNGY